MDLSGAFKECFLDGDTTSLYYVANALNNLQILYGLMPNVKGIGKCSKQVFEMMKRFRIENESRGASYGVGGSGTDASYLPEIDNLILIDRNIDLVTPLLTQLTYEGILDELFGIKSSIVELEPGILNTSTTSAPGAAPDAKKVKNKLVLNSGDPLFSELRAFIVTSLGPLLKKKAIYLKEIEEEKDQLKKKRRCHRYKKICKET